MPTAHVIARLHGSFRRDNGHVTGQEITALAETLVKRLRTPSSREQRICEVLLRKPKMEGKAMRSKHTLANLTRRMQGQPVTTCDECGRSLVGPDAPVSPLFIAMFDGGIKEEMEQNLCSWECAASWFAARAGGQFRQNPTPAGE